MLPTEKVLPNDWNPNQMRQEEFTHFTEVVRERKHLPKPIIVVKEANGYQIVDGEHGHRAAQEAGLAEVPCQVLALDQFERMLQTYQRNIHGRANPVLQGRLFERMREIRQLSNRQLAQQIGLSEGSIRNYLLYSEAMEVRNRYAAPKGRTEKEVVEEIASLPLQAVRAYLEVPDAIRDAWLDHGGSLEDSTTGSKNGESAAKDTNTNAKSWSRKIQEGRAVQTTPRSGKRGEGQRSAIYSRSNRADADPARLPGGNCWGRRDDR
jgi:ParB/RepB/Spo0J family partition protein